MKIGLKSGRALARRRASVRPRTREGRRRSLPGADDNLGNSRESVEIHSTFNCESWPIQLFVSAIDSDRLNPPPDHPSSEYFDHTGYERRHLSIIADGGPHLHQSQSSTATVDIVLAFGALSESIDVVASSAQVQADTAQVVATGVRRMNAALRKGMGHQEPCCRVTPGNRDSLIT